MRAAMLGNALPCSPTDPGGNWRPPHGPINGGAATLPKKQAARLPKCECAACG